MKNIKLPVISSLDLIMKQYLVKSNPSISIQIIIDSIIE